MKDFQEKPTRITSQPDGSCAVNVGVDDALQLLDDAIKCRAQQGESVLRIVLANDLLPTTENWYNHCVYALEVKLKVTIINHLHGINERQLLLLFKKYPYAIKIIWFRLAYEEYRGDNYQKVFADRFDINLTPSNRSQLMEFASSKPFAFEDDVSFRSYLWCLRFADEGDSVRGISSFTARALRVIDNMEEVEACSYASELYSRLENDQDVCKHVRIALKGEWREDFIKFIHVFKNRHALGNVDPWLDELYKSARRVVVGIKRKESRDSGRPDQLPQITLDFYGNVVLEPPVETSYEENTYSNGDEFRFYRSTDITACACWRFVDGIFDCNHRSVLLKKLSRIEFKRSGNVYADEIVKYLITDEGSGIGIYNVCPSSTSVCGYSLGCRHPVFYKDDASNRSEKLREGDYYKVVSIKGEVIPVIAYSAECPEGCGVPINEFSMGCGTPTNVFRVPTGTLRLQIGKMLFKIVDSRIDKLEHNPNFTISCVRNKCGGPAGYRFVYKRDVYPLHDICHVTGLWYEFDGSRNQMPILVTVNNAGWKTPDGWLWRSNGKLIMKTDDRNERAFPVTFVDVDFSEIEERPFSFGEGRHVRIRTGDEWHEYDVGPNDIEMSLEYRGIHFRPRINREGVQLCLQGKVIAASNGSVPRVEVAYGDILDDEAMLRIQVQDYGDMKFFYGDNGNVDILHPIDMPLRQDRTVFLRRFLDVVSFKEILPVDCMISLPSGFGAYSFRVYDSKSAVLEVVHGNYEKRVVAERMVNSDDLYIRYFVPYKHHVTSNQIELAYLLSHRQDEKPRYYPLEDRMLADDPQSLGRCVESVVAKDFFKHDIEWGTGVIGFIVERSQYGVNVQTTGFFIGAPNPEPVCLDGDVLRDLRIALSERQVRRDVPMSEADRQRLHRIENEFMSDDVQKQEALRVYIRNAATVAIELNALDSINSFCNSIRNQEGKFAWVSGFVFMAGWFVKEFINGEGFNDTWPFPMYWHPLLVAYRYQNVNPPEDERWELQVRYLLHDILEHYSQKDNCASLLLRVERMIAKIVPDGIVPQEGEVVIPDKPSTALCVFRTNGLIPREHTFSYFRLFKMLIILGEALDEWRMTPTLNELLFDNHDQYNFTLQDLREYLLFIDELDKELDNENLFCRKFITNIASKRFFNRKNQEMSHVSV